MYDVAETKRRGYSGKSKVFFDGREKLEGKDWVKRKKELWLRADGKCEYMLQMLGYYMVKCLATADDPHHIVKRSKQRDDRLKNLQALCRYHHRLIDKRKVQLRRIA